MTAQSDNIEAAKQAIVSLGLPRGQQNERSALCLLALLNLTPGKQITLSPGKHSDLIRAIIEEFAPRFAPGSTLVYVGDTAKKWGYFDAVLLAKLGVNVDVHGKMPDVVLYHAEKDRLWLVEAVTSHGPVDSKRFGELTSLFSGVMANLVFLTAFPNHSAVKRRLGEIAWETEVWVADTPSHLIHFDGERFIGSSQPSEALQTMLATEAVLRRDWDRPEEEHAWTDL